ncbi:MAG: transcriptional regulator [Clostridia bacterium]|nr:transcriptional regulator [Clostridia bacterium]
MDISKKVELSALYEIYGNSLTQNQQQVIDFCVLQDLSLGEVSDLLNISRQAVKYTLDNAITSMLKLEEKLKTFAKLQNLKLKLSNLMESTKDNNVRQQISKILEEL